mmetsp:Transcript_20968/g.23344  ORF Transcript_20968/g.23344 Transcript_20968/m.23344 type:complete len:174 (-) Transcript_20968:426-947(-)
MLNSSLKEPQAVDRVMKRNDIDGAYPNKFAHFHKKYDLDNFLNSKDNISDIFSNEPRSSDVTNYSSSNNISQRNQKNLLKNNGAQIIAQNDKASEGENSALYQIPNPYENTNISYKLPVRRQEKAVSQKVVPSLGNHFNYIQNYEKPIAAATPQANLPDIRYQLREDSLEKIL